MKDFVDMENLPILTFGYGNRKNYDCFEQYIEQYQVKFVVDVRLTTRAWSRKWYGDKIKEFCEHREIQYISKPHLGNTSGKQTWIPPNSEDARQALQEIAETAKDDTVLLLCAELNPQRCHRVEVARCLGKMLDRPIIDLE